MQVPQETATFQIAFDTFTSEIEFLSPERMEVRVVAGEEAGATYRVDYRVEALREGLTLLSWREEPLRNEAGRSVVCALDHHEARAFTVVAKGEGEWLRLNGEIRAAA